MKGRLLVAGLAVLMLAGCAQQKYKMVKSGITQETATSDDLKCQNQAMQVQFADFEYRGTFMEGASIKMNQQKVYNNCMLAKGYQLAPM